MRIPSLTPIRSPTYWHASQVGSSIAQNFGASISATGCFVEAGALALIDEDADAAAIPPDAGTAFSSPPLPVDFSADVAASERR